MIGVSFVSPPATAAWRHQGARSGFEVAYFSAVGDGHVIEGCTAAAVEDGAMDCRLLHPAGRVVDDAERAHPRPFGSRVAVDRPRERWDG